MKKTIFSICLFLTFSFSSFGQCTPNFLFTALGVPGIYPPNIPIPGVPLTGIADGNVGSNYNQTLTTVIIQDTSLDITTLVPTLGTILNIAGINPVMTLTVNHVLVDVQGLPASLTYTCDQSNCQFPSGVDGCVQISGVPLQSGTFPIDVNMTINVEIPSINDPILGTTLYAGGPIDIPTFSAVQYDLNIEGATSLENSLELFSLHPNLSNDYIIFDLNQQSTISVYNIIGELVFKSEYRDKNFRLSKHDIGQGVFFLEFFKDNKRQIHKFIIN